VIFWIPGFEETFFSFLCFGAAGIPFRLPTVERDCKWGTFLTFRGENLSWRIFWKCIIRFWNGKLDNTKHQTRIHEFLQPRTIVHYQLLWTVWRWNYPFDTCCLPNRKKRTFLDEHCTDQEMDPYAEKAHPGCKYVSRNESIKLSKFSNHVANNRCQDFVYEKGRRVTIPIEYDLAWISNVTGKCKFLKSTLPFPISFFVIPPGVPQNFIQACLSKYENKG